MPETRYQRIAREQRECKEAQERLKKEQARSIRKMKTKAVIRRETHEDRLDDIGESRD